MVELVRIGKLSEFPEGKMKKVFVKNKELLVANINGEISSIDDICTHEECSLADGFLQGEVVTCPCHLAQFNVKTGKKVANPATGANIEDEPSFKVKVENDEVFVEV
ncbi:MAG: non-heme iron oxygenase ferredoxin subunit [Candidatus Aenigmatarchaeota archaeon]